MWSPLQHDSLQSCSIVLGRITRPARIFHATRKREGGLSRCSQLFWWQSYHSLGTIIAKNGTSLTGPFNTFIWTCSTSPVCTCPPQKTQSQIPSCSHPLPHIHHLLILGTKHNLSSGSHRVKKSLFPFNHSFSPFFPFPPSFSPSPLGNEMSNPSTTFATTTFISIIAKFLPAQTVLPILNGRYALRSLTISGRLVHRSGTHSCGFSK
jgi:hypothetical protein